MKHLEFTVNGDKYDILTNGENIICIRNENPSDFIKLTMDQFMRLFDE